MGLGRRRSRAWRVAVVISLWVLWGVLPSCTLQRSFVFIGYFLNPTGPPPASLKARVRWINTPQGKVETWFIPGKNRRAGNPGPVVLFAHGNGGRISGYSSLLRGYVKHGISVMLCEYRGYGRSAGTPSQKKIVADFVKCYDLLVKTPEVDRSRIVFQGESLGSGVVCALSLKRSPAAMILKAPLKSVAVIMARNLVPRVFVLDPFDNEAALKRYDGPVLILHGSRDELVPNQDIKALSRAAQNSQVVTRRGAGHNFGVAPGVVLKFLAKHRIYRAPAR